MKQLSITISLILSLIISSCSSCPSIYTYQHPSENADGIKTGSLTDVKMDSAGMKKLIDCYYAGKFDQVHSILVYKDSLLVFEEYLWGNKYAWDKDYFMGDWIKWEKDSLHFIMSCTKSITSAITGIAVDKGYLKVDDPIFQYLPDHQEYARDGREKITVENLLTMTSGLQWDEWHADHGTVANDIDRIYIACQQDPVACVLEKDLRYKPGEKFTYSGGNMIVLGEVLRNATGRNILDFGKEYLFDPLGIDSLTWWQYENGAFHCDGTLRMTPRDMLKIGILYKNEGLWNGKRILSKDWIVKSRTAWGNNKKIRLPLEDTGRNDYGYTWWINEVSGGGKKANTYQASGWGGQEIIVIPDYNMVLVFTGGNYTVKKHIHQIIEDYILPSIKL